MSAPSYNFRKARLDALERRLREINKRLDEDPIALLPQVQAMVFVMQELIELLRDSD